MPIFENGIITESRDGRLIPIPLMANAIALVGTFAVLNNNGLAISSEDVDYSAAMGPTTDHVIGVWDHSAENTGAHGDVLCIAKRGQQFLFANSADPVQAGQLGQNIYVFNATSVCGTTDQGSRPVAGKFMGFDTTHPDYVWVEIA